MSKYENLIRKWDDPILKAVCEPVAPGENLSALMDLMDRACRKSKLGVGLAAPQVGIAKRVIFLNCEDAKGSIRARFLINPGILRQSEEAVEGKEGCLSYPGVWKRIPRPTWIEVQYEDEKRRPRRQILKGFAARVACHELDHLEGVCKVGSDEFPDYDPAPANPARTAMVTAAIAALALV